MIANIIGFIALLIPSVLIFRIIHAVIYRVTGDDDRVVLEGVIFVVTMIVLAIPFGLAVGFYRSSVLLGPYLYCLVAAALVTVGLILKGFGFAFERLIATIRGD